MRKWLIGGAVVLGVFIVALIMTPSSPQDWYQDRLRICNEMAGLEKQNCQAQLIADAQVKLDEMHQAKYRGE